MQTKKLEQLQQLFKESGFNPVIGDIYQQQEKWLNWYRGDVNDFHYYEIKTINGRKIGKYKKSLQMAKKSAEDWSSLLFNENTMLTSNDEKADKVIENVLKRNNFVDEISDFIELIGGAFGTGVLVEYVADGFTEVEFLHGDRIVVLSHVNKTIQEIAVINEFQKDKEYYTHITYHLFDGKTYKIKHELYSAKQKSYLGNKADMSVLFGEEELKDMRHIKVEDGYEWVEYYKEYEASVPFFQVFKFALTNNFDVNSPMGVPVTANAISVLESLDEAAESLYNDDKLSRKRIIYNAKATTTQVVKQTVTNSEGKTIAKPQQVSYFDPDDTLIQSAPMEGSEKFMEIFAPEFNATPRIEAIKFNLNLLSTKVGLGQNYYSFDPSKGVTATEVISKNSDTFRNRNKHLRRLEVVLINLMKSILYLENSVGVYNGDIEGLQYEVKFDDSIIVDDEKVLETYRNDAMSGTIPKWRYIAKQYKLSEKEAREWAKEAKEDDIFAGYTGIEDLEDELDEPKETD